MWLLDPANHLSALLTDRGEQRKASLRRLLASEATLAVAHDQQVVLAFQRQEAPDGDMSRQPLAGIGGARKTKQGARLRLDLLPPRRPGPYPVRLGMIE